jgi:hypothetical protein
MIKDEDLLAVTSAPKRGRRRPGSGGKQDTAGAAVPQKDAQQLLADMGGLSARERAAALRRAKSGLKRGLSKAPSLEPGSPTKKAKVGAEGGQHASGSEAAAGASAGAGEAGLSAEQEWQEVLAGRWVPRCGVQG